MSQILDEVLPANAVYADFSGDEAALALSSTRRFAIPACVDARHVIRNAGEVQTGGLLGEPEAKRIGAAGDSRS